MAEPAKLIATYADLEAVPSHLVAELIHGALVTHPRPGPRHSIAALALGAKLAPRHQWGEGGPGGWIFMAEPELHLGGDVVVPDVAAWRRERLPAIPTTAFVETSPDWVCEILSDATERFDRSAKRQIYADAGVLHLWLLDPRSAVLEVFQLTGGHWLLVTNFANNDEVSAVPFDDVAFPLGQLWPFDPPTD